MRERAQATKKRIIVILHNLISIIKSPLVGIVRVCVKDSISCTARCGRMGHWTVEWTDKRAQRIRLNLFIWRTIEQTILKNLCGDEALRMTFWRHTCIYENTPKKKQQQRKNYRYICIQMPCGVLCLCSFFLSSSSFLFDGLYLQNARISLIDVSFGMIVMGFDWGSNDLNQMLVFFLLFLVVI